MSAGRGAGPAWDQALDWLLEIEAGAPAARRRAFEAWLAASETHRQAYARAARAWRVTGALAAPRGTAGPVDVDGARAARRRPFRRWPVAALAAVAAAILLALAPMLRLAVLADHRTGTGEIRQVALPDGSTADLDAGSAIAVDYAATGRSVDLLDGRAYFAVTPDAARPFTVAAGGVTVTVTGTGFDVDLGEDAVSVTVASGTVAVALSAGAPVRLEPGDRLTVDRATGATARDRLPVRHVAAWRGGRLVVDGITLGRLVEELGRHHRGGIVLTDPDLARRRVTGVFDLGDPAAALRAAVAPHGGRIAEVTPFLLLVSSP